MAERRLETVLTGDSSKLARALDTAERRLSGFGSKAAGAGKAAAKGIGVASVAVAGVGAASFNLASDFDASMRQITGLVGIPKEEVDKLRGSVLNLAGETAKSPQELAQALFSVTSAGFDGSEALEVLDLAAKAAAAGLGDTQSVALTVGSAVNAYGKETLSAAQATDIMVGTVKAGNLSAEELSSALGKILPIASAAGVGLDDVGASVALITRSGSTASEAVTQMKAALQAMNAPGKAAAEALKEAGLSTADLQRTLSEDGLLAALRQVETVTKGDAVAMREFFGSSEALSGALTILNGDAQTVEGVFTDLKNTTGLTGQAFEVASDNAGFKMSQAFTQLKVAGIKLGDALLPLVAKLMDRLIPAIDGLIPKIETHLVPALQNTATFIQERVIPVVADMARWFMDNIVPAAIRVGQVFVNDVVPAVRSVIEWFGKAWDAVSGFVKSFTGDGGGEGGLAGIAARVGEKIKEIGPVVAAKLGELSVIVVEKLAELGKKFVEWVAPQIPPLLVELGKLLVDLGIWVNTVAVPKIIEQLAEWGAAFVGWIVPAIPPMLVELGKALADIVKYLVEEGGKAILSAAGAMWGEIETGAVNAWNERIFPWLSALPGKITSAVGDTLSTLYTQGWQLLSGFARGAVTRWLSFQSWVWNLPRAIAASLPSVLTTLLAHGNDLFNGFVNGVDAIWQSFKSWLFGLPGRIKDAVPSLLRVLYQAGKDFVQGLIDGLWSMKDKIPNPLDWLPSMPSGFGGGVSLLDLPNIRAGVNTGGHPLGGTRHTGGPVGGMPGKEYAMVLEGDEHVQTAQQKRATDRALANGMQRSAGVVNNFHLVIDGPVTQSHLDWLVETLRELGREHGSLSNVVEVS